MDFPKLKGLTEGLVDHRLVGLIRVDQARAVLEVNDRARKVLRADGGLRARKGLLCAHRPEDAPGLASALSAAFDDGDDSCRRSSTVIGAWPAQRPLTVHVNPLPPQADGRGEALVVIVDPWQVLPVDRVQVARSLGLTASEACVAAKLAEGLDVARIACGTNRSPDSVRRLVAQAMAKTWCRRQADLVRLVLSTSRLPLPSARQG